MSSAPIPAQGAGAIIAKLRPQMAAIQGAIAFPFNLPPILGLAIPAGSNMCWRRCKASRRPTSPR